MKKLNAPPSSHWAAVTVMLPENLDLKKTESLVADTRLTLTVDFDMKAVTILGDDLDEVSQTAEAIKREATSGHARVAVYAANK